MLNNACLNPSYGIVLNILTTLEDASAALKVRHK